MVSGCPNNKMPGCSWQVSRALKVTSGPMPAGSPKVMQMGGIRFV